MPDTGIAELDLLAPLTAEELYGYADTQLATNREQAKRGLAAAIGFCQTYTKRSLIPEGDDSAHPVTKTVRPRAGATVVRVPDVRAITAITVDGTTIDPATCELLPDGWGRPAPRLRLPAAGALLAITGTFGFLDVPSDIRDAIYTDAIRRSKDKDAAYGDRLEGADGTVISYFRSLPPRVQSIYNSMRIGIDFVGAA